MKKYEFKNYSTHKSAEIHLYKNDRIITYVVWYSKLGKPDCNPHGIAGCNNSAEHYSEEADAIRQAIGYIYKEV